MRLSNIGEMKKGWFVGDFSPTLYKTCECEVAYKTYKKGETEGKHYHKVATEITLIATGKVKMFEKEFIKGDIIIIEPGEATSFEALESSSTVVVKIPGASNDKYLI